MTPEIRSSGIKKNRRGIKHQSHMCTTTTPNRQVRAHNSRELLGRCQLISPEESDVQINVRDVARVRTEEHGHGSCDCAVEDQQQFTLKTDRRVPFVRVSLGMYLRIQSRKQER